MKSLTVYVYFPSSNDIKNSQEIVDLNLDRVDSPVDHKDHGNSECDITSRRRFGECDITSRWCSRNHNNLHSISCQPYSHLFSPAPQIMKVIGLGLREGFAYCEGQMAYLILEPEGLFHANL